MPEQMRWVCSQCRVSVTLAHSRLSCVLAVGDRTAEETFFELLGSAEILADQL